MRFGSGHSEFRFALDHGGHDLDMLAFARSGVGRQLPGLRGHGARLGALHVELMQACPRDVRQRKAFVFADRPVESILRPVPGRQHAIHAIAVMRRGAVVGGRQRQIISVPVHLRFS